MKFERCLMFMGLFNYVLLLLFSSYGFEMKTEGRSESFIPVTNSIPMMVLM